MLVVLWLCVENTKISTLWSHYVVNQTKASKIEMITLVIINIDIMIYHGKLVSWFGLKHLITSLSVAYVYLNGQNHGWADLDDTIKQELFHSSLFSV